MSDEPILGPDDWYAVLGARAWVDAFETAAQDPAVVSFRKDLPHGRLPSSNVFSWANATAEREGQTFLRVESFSGELPIAGYKPEVSVSKRPLWIEIGRHDSIPMRADGTLGRLSAIAHRLAKQFGWSVSWTAEWILTDELPEQLALTSTTRLEGNRDSGRPSSWSRITIQVPAEVPATTVARMHTRLRTEAAKHQPTLQLKGAPVGLKQLNAMIFCVARNDGRSWDSMMAEWHTLRCKGRPHWRYLSFRNFARDVRDTYQRVMGRSWRQGGRVSDGKA